MSCVELNASDLGSNLTPKYTTKFIRLEISFYEVKKNI